MRKFRHCWFPVLPQQVSQPGVGYLLGGLQVFFSQVGHMGAVLENTYLGQEGQEGQEEQEEQEARPLERAAREP